MFQTLQTHTAIETQRLCWRVQNSLFSYPKCIFKCTLKPVSFDSLRPCSPQQYAQVQIWTRKTYKRVGATAMAKSQDCIPIFWNHDVLRLHQDSLSLFHAVHVLPTCCCSWMCGNRCRWPGTARSFAPGSGPGGNSRSAHVGSSTGIPYSWGPASGGLIETTGGRKKEGE